MAHVSFFLEDDNKYDPSVRRTGPPCLSLLQILEKWAMWSARVAQ